MHFPGYSLYLYGCDWYISLPENRVYPRDRVDVGVGAYIEEAAYMNAEEIRKLIDGLTQALAFLEGNKVAAPEHQSEDDSASTSAAN